MTEFTADPGAASPRTHGRATGRGQLVAGAILVAVGAFFLADQVLGVNTGQAVRHFWPVILISIGIAKIATPRADGQPTGGYMLTMVGAILLMHTLHFWTLRTSWPLFIVAAGLNIIAGAVMQARFQKGNGHVS